MFYGSRSCHSLLNSVQPFNWLWRRYLNITRHLNKAVLRIRCLVLVSPIQDPIEVPALMPHVKVGKGMDAMWHPVVGDDANIRVTHQLLSQHLDAVI